VFILSIILFKSAINRADAEHILLTLIGVFLSISLILGRESKVNFTFVNKKIDSIVLASFCFAVFVLGLWLRDFAFLLSPVVLALVFFIQQGGGYLRLIKMLAVIALVFYVLLSSLKSYGVYNSRPLNLDSSNGVGWVAQVLISHNEKCIFDLTNNGIINALSNLPTCTKYSYPVYVPYKDEWHLLKQLRKSNPNFIVYKTTFWSYSIDGKSMANRYPEVDDFIRRNYSFSHCKFDYCIKSRFDF
jgi:hypothetical protein